MAVAVESTSSQGLASVFGAVTITAPTGITSGDMLVAVLGEDVGGALAWETKTGWTLANNTDNSDLSSNIQYKVATVSDESETDYTFDIQNYSSGALTAGGSLLRVSGLPTDVPFQGADGGTDNTGTSQDYTVSLGIDYDNTLLIMGIMLDTGNTSGAMSNYSTSAGSITFTEVQDSSLGNLNFAVAYGLLASKQDITSFSVTSDASGASAASIIAFNSQANASGTTNLINTTTNLNQGTGSAGTNGTADMTASTTTTYDIGGEGEADIWTNQNRSSTTWTNQNKS